MEFGLPFLRIGFGFSEVVLVEEGGEEDGPTDF